MTKRSLEVLPGFKAGKDEHSQSAEKKNFFRMTELEQERLKGTTDLDFEGFDALVNRDYEKLSVKERKQISEKEWHYPWQWIAKGYTNDQWAALLETAPKKLLEQALQLCEQLTPILGEFTIHARKNAEKRAVPVGDNVANLRDDCAKRLEECFDTIRELEEALPNLIENYEEYRE